METLKNLGEKHSDKLKYLFLIGSFIGFINTFCRADYNFIIYLYMFFVWTFMKEDLESQAKEKVIFFYILWYSLIIDIIWCFFWKLKWGILKEDIESGTHALVILFSWIGIILKLIIGLIILVSERNILKGTLPKTLNEKLNSGYMPQIDDRNQ